MPMIAFLTGTIDTISENMQGDRRFRMVDNATKESLIVRTTYSDSACLIGMHGKLVTVIAIHKNREFFFRYIKEILK
jgi:hypothetical protein